MNRDRKGAFLCLLLLTAAACSHPKEAETEPVVPVQVAEVRRDSIQRIIDADAILHPIDQAAITPKIGAPVRSFSVKRGDRVRKGQLLAVLENRDLAAAAAENKGNLDQATANYRNTTAAALPEEFGKAQLDATAAKQALDAAQKLYESRANLLKEGALAQRLVDEAKVAFVQAQTQFETARKHLESLQNVGQEVQIKSAEGQLEAARSRYHGAEAQLSYSEIRSPIDGVVTDRSIYPGEMASAGAPLLTVMNISQIVARANIPQSEAAYLKPGNAATISDSGGSARVSGKVTVVSPAVDPNSTTVEVWVQAPNPSGQLRPGATMHVAILAETLRDVTVIPAAAILPSQEGGTSVMAVGADSVAHEHKITVGVRQADKVQVLEGVAPGDRVVVVGGVGLQDGAKVRIGKEP